MAYLLATIWQFQRLYVNFRQCSRYKYIKTVRRGSHAQVIWCVVPTQASQIFLPITSSWSLMVENRIMPLKFRIPSLLAIRGRPWESMKVRQVSPRNKHPNEQAHAYSGRSMSCNKIHLWHELPIYKTRASACAKSLLQRTSSLPSAHDRTHFRTCWQRSMLGSNIVRIHTLQASRRIEGEINDMEGRWSKMTPVDIFKGSLWY